MHLYERAIKAAAESGFTHDGALASELAACFCLARGLESAGRAHLREAREGYLRWGAGAKVALLDEQFPGIDRPVIQTRPTTIEASVEQLDLAAIIKVSQALSSEIVTGRLIERLMVIAIEHAAAQRGLLILQRGDERRLEALAFSSDGGVTVRRVGRAVTPMDLPETILTHVTRQGRSVILDDASLPNAFSHDEYLRQKAPRSVLCLPLRRQGDLIGVLYLENNLASHVFTPARHTVLDLLSSQAAISLQNAELYARLEEENAERRQSEAALRRSEERYALAIEAATDGHGEYLADEGLFHSSPRLLEQWGLPPELAIVPRERMLELFPFHPDDRAFAVALLNQHRDSDTKRLEFDARVIRRGEVRWMHCTVLYVRDATGKLLRSSTATSDVTERKRAEEELRLSEERYALALAGSNEGVFDWDLRTGRTYLAARTQELLGLPVGDPWRSRQEWETVLTYYPGDFERMEAALEAHFSGRTPMYDHEVRFVLPNGQIRWFRARGTVLRDADGTPCRMVGSLGDITERKRQQEEMLRLEGRLRQAERFEAMGTLAGGIAHDFNNILGAILGFGERALRGAEEGTPAAPRPEQRRGGRRARAHAGRSHPVVQPRHGRRAGAGARGEGGARGAEPAAGQAAGASPAAQPPASRPRGDPGRCGADPPVADEPGDERGARDDAGGDADGVAGDGRGGAGAPGQGGHRGSRCMGRAAGGRRGNGDDAGDPGAHLRPVLHDQGNGRRNGPGAVAGAAHRDAGRRGHRCAEHAGGGQRVHRLLAACRRTRPRSRRTPARYRRGGTASG